MTHDVITKKYTEVYCGKCGAQPGHPCVTGMGSPYKTGFVHNTRKLAFRKVRATGKAAIPQNFRMVHCPYCGAKPGQPCTTKHGDEVKLSRETHKDRRLRFKKAVNMMIAAAEVTAAKMVGGNEKKYSRVIMNDTVYDWIGIGWVKVGPPAYDDDLLPRVIEPTFSVMVTRGTASSFAKKEQTL